MQISTAVRNIGQWPKGRTGNLNERNMIISVNKILNTYWLWRYVYKSWLNMCQLSR